MKFAMLALSLLVISGVSSNVAFVSILFRRPMQRRLPRRQRRLARHLFPPRDQRYLPRRKKQLSYSIVQSGSRDRRSNLPSSLTVQTSAACTTETALRFLSRRAVIAFIRPTDPHGLDLSAKPGETYYVRIDILTGFWKGHGGVTLVDPQQGKYEAAQTAHKGSDEK